MNKRPFLYQVIAILSAIAGVRMVESERNV